MLLNSKNKNNYILSSAVIFFNNRSSIIFNNIVEFINKRIIIKTVFIKTSNENNFKHIHIKRKAHIFYKLRNSLNLKKLYLKTKSRSLKFKYLTPYLRSNENNQHPLFATYNVFKYFLKLMANLNFFWFYNNFFFYFINFFPIAFLMNFNSSSVYNDIIEYKELNLIKNNNFDTYNLFILYDYYNTIYKLDEFKASSDVFSNFYYFYLLNFFEYIFKLKCYLKFNNYYNCINNFTLLKNFMYKNIIYRMRNFCHFFFIKNLLMWYC